MIHVPPHRTQAGFTGLEIILVLTFVGGIAVLGLVAVRNFQHNQQTSLATMLDTGTVNSPATKTPPPSASPSATPKVSSPTPRTPTPTPVTNNKSTSSIASDIIAADYQEVDLTNGTHYFGTLQQVQPGLLRLSPAFVLVIGQSVSPITGKTITTSSLKKNEIDPLAINTIDVATWANLPADNMYSKAITSYLQSQ